MTNTNKEQERDQNVAEMLTQLDLLAKNIMECKVLCKKKDRALAARIAVYERGQEAIEEVTTLKAAIVALRRDVDQLTSTDMSMIFVEELADPESEIETDEKMLEVAEEVSYEGLTETEEAMVDAAMQTTLAETPLDDPSGSGTVDMTLNIDAQD
uniref:Polyprotein protein n=1 Tax=Solanum tuberosum TaxID=4113 RepID=M1DMM1_SOLTU